MDSLAMRQYLGNLQVEYRMGGFLRCPPGWQDIDYTPDYHKFYFIRDGECELVIGGQVIRPKPGEMVLMPAGVQQSYYLVSNNRVEKFWCHFTAAIGGVSLFDLFESRPVVRVADCAGMEALFRRLFAAHGSDSVSAVLEERAALLELIARYLTLSQAALRPAGEEIDFRPVLRYIELHLRQDIPVADLAGIVSLHPRYFISRFKSRFGCPPKQYIGRRRMENAKTLLQTTDLPVGAVADACGFTDPFYFSRLFKRVTGFSPTDFRSLRLEHAPGER